MIYILGKTNKSQPTDSVGIPKTLLYTSINSQVPKTVWLNVFTENIARLFVWQYYYEYYITIE